MAAIQIKDVPDYFLRDLKVAAAQQGQTLKDFVVETLAVALAQSKQHSPESELTTKGGN